LGFQIDCPNCGKRPYTEFSYGGELPAPAADDYERAWMRNNVAGLQRERWFHDAGCRRWLTVERNTVTNEISGVA
jgi:sarcosine oxidase, subunit delta